MLRSLLLVLPGFLCLSIQAQTASKSKTLPEVISIAVTPQMSLAGYPETDTVGQVHYAGYLHAAQDGDSRAMNFAGMANFYGSGTSINLETAKEWFSKAGQAGSAFGWINLGLLAKFGIGQSIDYTAAYKYFSMAADLGSPYSDYMKGYMLYKGLGCAQNYALAYSLFRQGALAGNTPCMYFLGLCLRNGYGVPQNMDSARVWLTMAARKGYQFAREELGMPIPENDPAAAALVKNVQLFQNAALPVGVNTYQQVYNKVPENAISGSYKGYLIKYDYSGQHIVSAGSLALILSYDAQSKTLSGEWNGGGSPPVAVNAVLRDSGIRFLNTSQLLTDRYLPGRQGTYTFKDARLQLNVKEDSVFLSGNVDVYSEQMQEPEKPITLALVRVADKPVKAADVQKGILLSVYPNPFTDVLNVSFALSQPRKVNTLLYDMEGRLVYSNPAGTLQAGAYRLDLQPGSITPGAYVLVLQYDSQKQSVNVIKL